MSTLFHPITRQAALAAVRALPARLRASTDYSYLYRGSEGKSLMAKPDRTSAGTSCSTP